jgi:hypothetical protein
VPSSDHDKRLRAELAAELGWYPADLDDESIARHRADAAHKKTDRDPAKKWAHLTERARQREVEAAGAQPWRTCTSNDGEVRRL